MDWFPVTNFISDLFDQTPNFQLFHLWTYLNDQLPNVLFFSKKVNTKNDEESTSHGLIDWSSQNSTTTISQYIQKLEKTTVPKVKWLIIFKNMDFDKSNFDNFTLIDSGPRYLQFETEPDLLTNWLSSSPINPEIESILFLNV